MIILLFTAIVPGSRLCQPKLSLTSVAFAEEVAEAGSRLCQPKLSLTSVAFAEEVAEAGSRFQVPGSRKKNAEHGTLNPKL